MAVASGQDMQVMFCITNKLLRDYRFLYLIKKTTVWEKNEKSETDFKRRPFYKEHHDFVTKIGLCLKSHTIFCPIHKVLHVNCIISFGIPTA